jgi:isopentenyl phosphate kinase (EC 2.7.4.-)
LKKIKEPIIIVHGGGSYGHYWSVKYDMHTKEKNMISEEFQLLKIQ